MGYGRSGWTGASSKWDTVAVDGLGLALSGIRLQLASRFGPGKRIVNESEEDLNEHEKIRALPR